MPYTNPASTADVVVELQPVEPSGAAGPVEASIRDSLPSIAHVEQAVLVEIAQVFDVLDWNDDNRISRDEFKRSILKLNLHRPEGAADAWKDDAFDKFDVAREGSISYSEFTFALAQTVLSERQQGLETSAMDCFKMVLSETQQAQTEAKEGEGGVAAVAPGTYGYYDTENKRRTLANTADVEALHAKSKADEWQDSCCALAVVAIWPFYLCCCSNLGKSTLAADGGAKYVGLPAVVSYVTGCKDANATYYWSIQNYHYKVEVIQTKKGTRTKRKRVNTHFAQTRGVLNCTDQSSVFVPNMRKRNCALGSTLDVKIAHSFESEYGRRRELFYSMNTRDTHQDKVERFELPGMREAVRCVWAEDGEEDPWYANTEFMCCSVVTCWAACWFYKMRGFMCNDGYVFRKRATSFRTA
jgi:hypothetical protein